MKNQSNLKVNSKEFKTFLQSLSRINDSSILELKSNEIYSIASSDDRSMFLWSSLSGNFDVETTLNLPSLSKLSKLLDMVALNEISLKVNHNNLEYGSKTAKFVYHLYDDGILMKPKITLAKIKSLTFDNEFYVSKTFLKTLLSNSSIFKDTNKLYIYTEEGNMVWSLADRTMQNTDTLTVIGEEVDFEMDEFILNLDNVRLIDFGESDIAKFEVSGNGIGKISIESGKIQLSYIVSSLTK